MTSDASMLAAWSQGLAGIGFTAFLLRLLHAGFVRPAALRVRSMRSMPLLAALVASALWAWCGLADVFSDGVADRAAAAAADVGRYAGWCWWLSGSFALLGADRSSKPTWRLLRVVPAVVVVVALPIAVWMALASTVSPSRLPWFGVMALPIVALVLLEQLYRNIHEDARWNAKPLCLGLAGTFLFDLYLFSQALLFGRPDPEALAIRGAVQAMMIPLLWLSFSRRGDWISKLRVSRKAAFHSATLLIAGVYLLFVSLIGYYVRYFGGDWGRALEIGIVVAALVGLGLLALSGAVRARLKVSLGKHFFQYRYDYREEWLRFTQTLSAQNSPHDMGRQIVKGMADMLESPAGSLWTRPMGEAEFRNTANWNMAATTAVEPAESDFGRFLMQRGWVINIEQHRDQPALYGDLRLPDWLTATPRGWLVVPLIVADALTGFVVLTGPRTPLDVNWEVNDLLKTAGRQAASFLAQMQATEALLEVRKFDAFNRMSAFVVHDLKNIVTQLSLMMKNAKRLQDNPEFQRDMLMTVENSLDRMRQLMLQLREGATPAGTAFGVDLSSALQRIESQTASKGRSLALEVSERVTARGDTDRLHRVVGHVVQNALDATDQGGDVAVRLDRHGGNARIEVADTGQGMTEEFLRERLFKPFQTTKTSGMGIGAYESFQYVRELGGSIDVHSKPGRGTKVTILLPLFAAGNESDLHLLKAS